MSSRLVTPIQITHPYFLRKRPAIDVWTLIERDAWTKYGKKKRKKPIDPKVYCQIFKEYVQYKLNKAVDTECFGSSPTFFNTIQSS